MGLFKLGLMSEEDKNRVHQAALKILSEGKVLVQDEEVLKGLKKKGARVEEHSGYASLPEELIKEVLERIEKKLVLNRVTGEAMHFYGENRYWGALNVDPIIVDYQRGIRKPVVDDVARHARLCDYHDKVGIIYKMEVPCEDVPEAVSEYRTLSAFISNTTTAYECAPISMDYARLWVQTAEIMAGGSLRDNPVLLGNVAIISPFYLDPKAVEMMRYFIREEVPLRIQPCPMSGSTSPYSLAGTLVQGWAELLFQLTVSYIIDENARVSVCLVAQEVDMKKGFYLGAGPVREMIYAAGLELTAHFGLSTSFGAFGTLVSNYGLQNGYETLMCALISTAAKQNHNPRSIGSIANATGISSEQILLDLNLIELGEWYAEGIDFSDDMLAVDSILSVGPRGHFLTEDMTLDLIHTREHFYALQSVRAAAGKDETTFADNLHRRAEEIIQTHKPRVPQDRLEKAHRFLSEQEKGAR